MVGLDENYSGELRRINVTTVITFTKALMFTMSVPASDTEANIISVVKNTATTLNSIDVNVKGTVTGGSNGQVRVFFIGK